VTANPWSAVDAATVPAKLARELRDAWERFVADAPVEEEQSDVRGPIAASWARSRDAGVDPHGYALAPAVVAPGDVHDCWEQHPLAAAGPLVRECLRETAIESGHLVVVADAEGTLLLVDGDVRVRSRAADMMNFAAGTLWSERGAGTNAIGTALAAGHAVQVFAAEHFTEPVQRWTCSAAPVREPDAGRVNPTSSNRAGVTLMNNQVGYVVAKVMDGKENVEIRDLPSMIRVDGVGKLDFDFEEIADALGWADFGNDDFEEIMSTHYGRMVVLDDRVVLFANPEDAAEYIGFDLKAVQ
jgi:MmoB/DmpM family